MNNDSEEWNAKEWMDCLTLREKVMADYLRLLQKYNRLPAADYLVERELLKKYSEQTLDETFDAIVPPANYLIHEWNKDEHPEELCYMTVRVVDKKGNLCPFADNLIVYKGDGFVAAANGDAACLDSFIQPQMHAFAGQCTFIVKKGTKGTLKLIK